MSEETGRHRDKERQEQTWTERKAGMVREGERERERERERQRETERERNYGRNSLRGEE